MNDDPLIPVFIPALVVLLTEAEKAKGFPLTRDEVLEIRDKGVCMMMPRSKDLAMADSRGYDDIEPEFAWEQWQEIRETLTGPG